MKHLETDVTKKRGVNNKVILKYIKGEMKKRKDILFSRIRLNVKKIIMPKLCVCFNKTDNKVGISGLFRFGSWIK